MDTNIQYNPQADHDAVLREIGVSKTVYALVTPHTERVKDSVFGDYGSEIRQAYRHQFREAWTGKQDAYHQDFFEQWIAWSAPAVDLDRDQWPFSYPTAGASEPLRHLIYDLAVRTKGQARVHVFEGEYEGYAAMARSSGLTLVTHAREHACCAENIADLAAELEENDLFFISQPSAIDGNVWEHYNLFVDYMPDRSIVSDVTYVGAVPQGAVKEQINLNAPSLRNIVFSLSKPFGMYYDRIGGVFAREQDDGLFGNRWFKNLTSLSIGRALLKAFTVYEMPSLLAPYQQSATQKASEKLGIQLVPSDVILLATAMPSSNSDLTTYLKRAGRVRLCLTPSMAEQIAKEGGYA